MNMKVDRVPSSQDVSWFLDLDRHDQLDLNPPYQRRSVWSRKDRAFFLDTIFRGYPSPAIYLNKEMLEGGKTQYAVVDGKQRLETIIMFSKDQIAIAKDFGDYRLDGRKWSVIKEIKELAEAFWNYTLPVEQINISGDPSSVNEVFDRLNRNSRKLTRQELRHAKWEGWFIEFAEGESDEPDWETLGVVTTARRKRMSDVQFLSQLLIVVLRGEVFGFDQDLIDSYHADYESPEEEDLPGFNENSTKKAFVVARKYLVEMEKAGSAISTYAKEYKNLYSLWALVVLQAENLPSPEDLTLRYKAFMDKVETLKVQDDLQEFFKKQKEENFSDAHKYLTNSTGASTEEPQRKSTYDVLVSVLLS